MEVAIRYNGPGSAVHALAGYLREEGLEVTYEPPPEFRSFPEPAQLVIIYVALKAVDAAAEVAQDALKVAIRRAIDRFRQRGGPGEVEGD
jgi:hypothetical protein